MTMAPRGRAHLILCRFRAGCTSVDLVTSPSSSMGPGPITFRARILYSGMLTFRQFVWFSGCLIEVAILARSIQCKSFGKYSLFYAYIMGLFGVSLFLRAASIARAPGLSRFYLPLEFITCVLGC